MKNKYWKIVKTNLYGPTVNIEDFEENSIVEGIAYEKAVVLVKKHNQIVDAIDQVLSVETAKRLRLERGLDIRPSAES